MISAVKVLGFKGHVHVDVLGVEPLER